jgi:hypothetical protein
MQQDNGFQKSFLAYFPYLETTISGKKLIAYFLFIQHGPRRKWHLQKFFVVVRRILPRCYLAMIERYIDRPTDTRVQQFFYCCVYPLPRERVYRAVDEEWKEGYTLSNFCLATIGRIRIQTHRLMGGIYEVRRWDGSLCRDMHSKFNNDWFRHSRVKWCGFTDTQIYRHTDSMEIA